MVTQPELSEDFGQQLVLAHRDASFAREASRCLRRLGWDVYTSSTAEEARLLTRVLCPSAVILDTDLADETGWLTCAKLTRELPDLKVYLVTPRRTAEQVRFADFVGASGLVWRYGGMSTLAAEIQDATLPVAS